MDGRWRSFDPALIRFDSSHIALDIGDGNPWHFFNATTELGNIQIDAVHTFAEMYDATSPGGVQSSGGGGQTGGGIR